MYAILTHTHTRTLKKQGFEIILPPRKFYQLFFFTFYIIWWFFKLLNILLYIICIKVEDGYIYPWLISFHVITTILYESFLIQPCYEALCDARVIGFLGNHTYYIILSWVRKVLSYKQTYTIRYVNILKLFIIYIMAPLK